MLESIKKRWEKKKAYEVINCAEISTKGVFKKCSIKSNLHCLGTAILLIIFE